MFVNITAITTIKVLSYGIKAEAKAKIFFDVCSFFPYSFLFSFTLSLDVNRPLLICDLIQILEFCLGPKWFVVWSSAGSVLKTLYSNSDFEIETDISKHTERNNLKCMFCLIYCSFSLWSFDSDLQNLLSPRDSTLISRSEEFHFSDSLDLSYARLVWTKHWKTGKNFEFLWVFRWLV